ncbi:MAG: mannitol dehydrogenase family protein [Sphingomonadales bacterium]|nr:mannitol dehydrogenase family protein [Sphingomonadales bacterium]
MSTPRLSDATLARVSSAVAHPGYDRGAQRIGIVHLGLGAFARAHLACYTDDALAAGERDWAIAGVSLRTTAVAAQLGPQDGLFTLAERSGAGLRARIIGAIREVVAAPQAPGRAEALIAAPTTHIVSLTVTEKAYASDAAPGGLYPLLAEGLRRRRAAGLAGLTLVSCDNLAGNGRVLEAGLCRHLEAGDAALARWVADECAFPVTMVDRIVPATTEADRAAVAQALGGVSDEGAVVTEPFRQWVIEDRFAGPRPGWEHGGAALVSDVAPYEAAKLRMLNGAHSALAYLGLERGHGLVHEAIADPSLRALVERLMREEAAPTIAPAPGQDLAAYATALLARFANPALRHRLVQIAADGSSKLPQRWLPVLAENRRRGVRCPAILAALGGWLRHVRGDNVRRWGAVEDPQAQALAALASRGDAASMASALFGPGGLLAGHWQPDAADLALIIGA